MKRFISDDCERDFDKLVAGGGTALFADVEVVLSLISMGISIGISTSEMLVVVLL